ncbi:unnamed protein product [Musa acuminata var. zebrina]
MLPIYSFSFDLTTLPGQVRIEKGNGCDDRGGPAAGCGFCAICLEKIALQDMSLVKGCEHAYCVTCILRWALYNEKPSCHQCKHPFEFLNILRSWKAASTTVCLRRVFASSLEQAGLKLPMR